MSNYITHITQQPLVDLARRSLRFAFGWTVVAAVILMLLVLFSYFFHDPVEVPDWKESNLDMGFYAMLLSSLNLFLAVIFFAGGTKNIVKSSAREGFFSSLLSLFYWILALPFIIFFIFLLTDFYHSLINSFLKVVAI